MDLTTIVGGVAVAVIAYFVFFKKKTEDKTPAETTTTETTTTDASTDALTVATVTVASTATLPSGSVDTPKAPS